MFHSLLIAYDGSAESCRALKTGITLAKNLGAALHAITVEEGLPPYVSLDVAYTAMAPTVVEEIEEQRQTYYDQLEAQARARAEKQGVALHTAVVTGDEVAAVVEYARQQQCDLILVGYHKHSAFADRLWGSTVHGITMAAECSVLAVK